LSFKKWSKKLIGFIFLSFAKTVLFNFIVDPYAMFNTVKIDGFNKIKNHTINDAMSKFYNARNSNPTILLIGTSRTEHIHPKYLAKYEDGKIYNLAIGGSGLSTHKKNIEYFIKNYKIKTIVYGVDFFSFSPYNKPSASSKYSRYENYFYNDYLDSLLGFKTLRRSIRTVKENLRNKENKREYDIGWATFANDYSHINLLGDKYIRKNINKILKVFSIAKDSFNYEAFKEPQSIDKNLLQLSEIIQLCNENKVKLHLFIPPIFSEITDLIYHKKYDRTYKYWKKSLAQYGNIYDFSGYNSITKDLHYYIDGSHYNKEVGKLILAKIFNDQSIKVPDDFGIILNKNNIDDILKNQEKEVKILNLQ